MELLEKPIRSDVTGKVDGMFFLRDITRNLSCGQKLKAL